VEKWNKAEYAKVYLAWTQINSAWWEDRAREQTAAIEYRRAQSALIEQRQQQRMLQRQLEAAAERRRWDELEADRQYWRQQEMLRGRNFPYRRDYYGRPLWP